MRAARMLFKRKEMGVLYSPRFPHSKMLFVFSIILPKHILWFQCLGFASFSDGIAVRFLILVF